MNKILGCGLISIIFSLIFVNFKLENVDKKSERLLLEYINLAIENSDCLVIGEIKTGMKIMIL